MLLWRFETLESNSEKKTLIKKCLQRPAVSQRDQNDELHAIIEQYHHEDDEQQENPVVDGQCAMSLAGFPRDRATGAYALYWYNEKEQQGQLVSIVIIYHF